MTEAGFWNKAREAGAKATWGYLATTRVDQPEVPVVHLAIESNRVWVATGRNSAKATQIGKTRGSSSAIRLGSDVVHLTIRGRARFVEDPIEKSGSGREPESAELTSLTEMTQGKSPERWRLAK